MSITVGLFCASIGKQGLITSESIEGEKIYDENQGGRRSAVQILRMRRARPTAVRRINNSIGFPYVAHLHVLCIIFSCIKKCSTSLNMLTNFGLNADAIILVS